MNVFCCLNENRDLSLGIPSVAAWSIKAIPSEGGSVLTLQLEGTNEIQLADGHPVNLSEQVIEIKEFGKVCADILGPVTHINVTHPSDEINYFKGATHPRDADASLEMTDTYTDSGEIPATERTQHLDRTAFYKWGKILTFLENHFGEVTVAAWFEDAVVVEFTADVLMIEVGSEFRGDIINRRCLGLVKEALAEFFNSSAEVKLCVRGQSV